MFRNPFWKLAGEIWHYRWLVVPAMICAIIAGGTFGAGLGVGIPVMELLLNKGRNIQDLIHEYLVQPDRPEMLQQFGVWLASIMPQDRYWSFVAMMGGLMGMSIFGSLFRYAHAMLMITALQQLARRWQNRMFARIIHFPMQRVVKQGATDLMSRIMFDVNALMRGYQVMFTKAMIDIAKAFSALVMAMIIDWQLTAIALIGGPVVWVVLRKLGKTIRRNVKHSLALQARTLGVMKETMGALAVVKTHNAEGRERRRYRVHNRELLNRLLKTRKAKALAPPLVETVAQFGITVVACIAAWRVLKADVSPAQFMGVLGMLVAAGASLRPLSSLNSDLNEAAAAAERIIELLKEPVEPAGQHRPKDIVVLPRHASEVRFENIDFTYEGADQPALRDVSLAVSFGQTVAIVGPNGSGKTTLLSLLPRLYRPGAGRILIDGVDISRVSLRDLRDQVGVVTQDSMLFAGTLAENIAYGRTYEPMEKIRDAARAACAEEFILKLPEQYQAKLGEGGSGLSGGQRQRLCIARAILRNPAILILDEATSQIDTDSEANINQALDQLRKGRTTFVIAHRLSTVVGADQIVVMNQGRIEAVGRHAELMQSCVLYQSLCRHQLVLDDQPGVNG